MHIQKIEIAGFRNFRRARVTMREKTLVIGANDVGKTNLIYALRLLLDRSLSDAEIDPDESDFFVNRKGNRVSQLSIKVTLARVDKDAVITSLKGAVSKDGETVLVYRAERSPLKRKIFIGPTEALLEEIPSRHYLKYLNLRYVKSQRDLASFVRLEKKHLLQISRDLLTAEEQAVDESRLSSIGKRLERINESVKELNYVSNATSAVNAELKALAYHHDPYEVRLDTGAIQMGQFIEKLELAGLTGGAKVGVGGDGRSNQILLALWKAKSEREHDLEHEEVLYCIEEPEAHLHPHQQRKLASYLVKNLKGQVIVTSHSPQITVGFSPDSIVRLKATAGATVAASGGCSSCIEVSWSKMGYRMSVLPTEAFFASAVLLVEGPSEVLFYQELARQMKVDLDYYNISILSVDGIDFSVYVRILNAMEIPWVMRTDNDLFKVPRSKPTKYRRSGIERALACSKSKVKLKPLDSPWSSEERLADWAEYSAILNTSNIFISKLDLETDLVDLLQADCLEFSQEMEPSEAVSFFQKRKALHMGAFLLKYKESLSTLENDSIAAPIKSCLALVKP